jgi:hypothetical protein
MKTSNPDVSKHAEVAFRCILAYKDKTHRDIEPNSAFTTECLIKALITDIGHFCDEYCVNFEEALKDAEYQWRHER